jgi:DNA primase
MNKVKNIPDEELKQILGKVKIGPKNHYISSCPFCLKEKHFYISRTKQCFDCKKCGVEGNIIKLLSHVGKLFFLGEYKSIDRKKISKLGEINIIDDEEQITTLDVKTIKKPIGFKRVFSDVYLEGRGFSKKDFLKYEIGYTNLLPSLKDYVIFLIKENNECKGFVSRYTKKIINKEKLRYNNSRRVNFSHLLFGFDEINSNTRTVIIVEGLIDKITLDRYLNLDLNDEIKCVATFGKKISKFQVLKLQSKGVEDVVLIYDYDAIKEMKKYSVILNEFFDVSVGFTFKKDINDSSKKEVYEIFNNLKTPIEFNKKIVSILK